MSFQIRHPALSAVGPDSGLEQGGAVSAQAPKNRQSVTAALRLIDPVHGITPQRYPELV